jgi:uncharacterized protein (TIGR01319 family)
MAVSLFIDFGSTFTKVTAVDLKQEIIVASAKSFSTVDTDVMVGLGHALEILKEKLGVRELAAEGKFACSSAAGGLRMVAVGLVPKLTVEAARLAALSAGAKLVGAYSYNLTNSEIEKIIAQKPDVILLAGGTDGGNMDVVVCNARTIAESGLCVPVVMAGNKAAQDSVRLIFSQIDNDLRITANVLPNVQELNIEPCRQTIREVFLDRIIYSKGIDKAMVYIDDILMPTPTAVLQAARLLAGGTKSEQGLGDLVVVDVGGATTDIHSIGLGKPTQSNVILKGLPEPYLKRTVEGDLGVRYNALSILEAAGADRLGEISGLNERVVEEKIRYLSANTSHVPQDDHDVALDRSMAYCAVDIAMNRHAGRLEHYYSPAGTGFVQYGKDLTGVQVVIGTGGPLVESDFPLAILRGVLFDPRDPLILKPREPSFYIDRSYMLYAMGLLAETHPDAALRIMKKNLALQRDLR